MSKPRIETPYSITFDGTSYSFTITYADTYDPNIFTAYTFILSAVTGHSNFFVFGPMVGKTTLLDWRLCTNPVAASRSDLLDAIQALITSEVTFKTVHVEDTLTLDGYTANRVLYVNNADPKEVTSGPELASNQVLGGSSAGPPEAKTISGVVDEIDVTHTPGSISIGINSAYKEDILESIEGTTNEIDVSKSNETVSIGISSNFTLDHGNLQGLSDDDHTIYLRADGTRELTGHLISHSGGADLGSETQSFVRIYGGQIFTANIESHPAIPNNYITFTEGLTRIGKFSYGSITNQPVIQNPWRYYDKFTTYIPALPSNDTYFHDDYLGVFLPLFKGFLIGVDFIFNNSYENWTTNNSSSNTITLRVKNNNSTLYTVGPFNKSDVESNGIGQYFTQGKAYRVVPASYPYFSDPPREITLEFTTGEDFDGHNAGMDFYVVLHVFYSNHPDWPF